MREGNEITLGQLLDSVSLVVGDRVRADDAWLVFPGDTLFVGDVGRPDLHDADNTAKYAGLLYDSLFDKLLKLDDAVEIYLSHFAGSFCGRSMSGKPSSHIGFVTITQIERLYTLFAGKSSRPLWVYAPMTAGSIPC